jgi:Uma2 family endonuclease
MQLAAIQPSTQQAAEPTPRRWTRSEFQQMADLGWFAGQRVELIEGEVMVLSPQKFPHYATCDRVAETLRRELGAGCWVRIQAPLDLGPSSEPEPDVSVVAGSRDDYTDHPTTALLIVEVSDTTLANDRGRKASLYARSNIADYWIVNLVDAQLEVRRNPVADSSQPYGFSYADETVLQPSEFVTPLNAPQARIAVADLLP